MPFARRSSRRGDAQALADVLFDLTILATSTRVRGIGRYLVELAPALQRAAERSGRVRLSFLERSAWVGGGRVSDDARASIERLLGTPEPEPRMAWAYRQRVGLARATRLRGARLLHLGYPNVTPLGAAGCPRVLTCHDLIPQKFPRQYRAWQDGYSTGRRALDARRYGGARHVIAISRATADDLMALVGVPAERISVVPNGVSLERWSAEVTPADEALRTRYGLGARRLLVYAGDGDYRKNADGMLAALALVRRRRPSSDFTLVWLGTLGAETRRRILRQATDTGVRDAVRLVGWVPDEMLAGFYRIAHATLFVSRAEGFGYPVLEAMATGSAVVTSNTSSLVELAGDVALTVDPESPAAIAEAVLSVATGDPARRARVEAGRRWVSSFSVERQAEGTLDVYERVLRAS